MFRLSLSYCYPPKCKKLGVISISYMHLFAVFLTFQLLSGDYARGDGKHGRANTLAYILVDNAHSAEALEIVSDNVDGSGKRNDSTERRRLKVVNAQTRDDACRVVGRHPVVHLTRLCLPSHAAHDRIPIVSTPCERKMNFQCSHSHSHLSFASGDGLDAAVVAAVARSRNWTSTVYVGDSNEDTSFVDRLMHLNSPFRISEFVFVKKETDVEIVYAGIVESGGDFVLVHCHTLACYRVAKKLFRMRDERENGDLRRPWLMTGYLSDQTRAASSIVSRTTYGFQKAIPNTPDVTQLLHTVPSLQLSQPLPTNFQQQLQVLDFHDSLLALFHILENKNKRNLTTPESLRHTVNKHNLRGIGGPIEFDIYSERTFPFIYNILDISPFRTTTVGVYDVTTGWMREMSPVSVESSRKLNRRYRSAAKQCTPANGVFRATTMIEPPFVIYDPNNTYPDEAHNSDFVGIVVDMMNWIAKEMQFTYTMSVPPDKKYGLVNKSGEGNGMVGQVMRCEVDLIAAAIEIRQSRAKYIHFTEPYIDVGKSLLAYKNEPDKSKMWSFLEPFDVSTRAMIVGVTVFVCISFLLTKRWSPQIKNENTDDMESTRWGQSMSKEVTNSLWIFYTSAMQQGPETIPSLSGSVLVAGWFFFCLVIVATYTANLAAFLTSKSFTTHINSIHDLAAQTEIVYGTVRDTSIVDFLETSTLPVHRRLYNFISTTDHTLVETAEEAIERVHERTKGEFIFIWDEPILEYIASNRPCKSQVIGKRFSMHAYALAMPKGMPYAENFSLAILKLRESGYFDELTDKWLGAGECDSYRASMDETDVKQLTIVDLQGVFVILASTVALAVVVAVAKRIVWRVRRPKCYPKQKKVSSDVNSVKLTSLKIVGDCEDAETPTTDVSTPDLQTVRLEVETTPNADSSTANLEGDTLAESEQEKKQIADIATDMHPDCD
ncbi:glutamate receptor 4-like [Corticium candelabrum]|uniref:glutamate receptor 4-like n=1 Tax=Corticium candelabrum TaxID=121492 RepID=UPI002E265A43|nr:glutamate receptor 4-like [Corticium candelabrum]